MLKKIKEKLEKRKADKKPGRFLSFHILYLCIFLPPVLYILTIQGLERYYQDTWQSQLGHNLLQDRSSVLDGSIRLQDEIKKNIESFFEQKIVADLGVMAQTVVRTGQGNLIYPDYQLDIISQQNNLSGDEFVAQLQRAMVARENRQLLEQGLNFHLSVQIPHNTWLANLVLIFYILVFSMLLYRGYQFRLRESEQAEKQQQEELMAARTRFDNARAALAKSARKEQNLRIKLDSFKEKLQEADNRVKQTEEAALEELEMLEEKLAEATSQRESREEEISKLSLELESLDQQKEHQHEKKEKQQKTYSRRFNTLYKNIHVLDRALEGFLCLPEDWKLKAEEILHTLNADKDKVSVKRKVFSKGRVFALETEFAHKGRIYWRVGTGNKPEILVIGTKNSQDKDLRYLQNLYGQESQG